MSGLFDLTGKVALITGSSKGIGRAIAEEMARHGAQVVISSRKGDICQEVADGINAELEGQPGGAVAIPAHIGHKEELQRLVDETCAQLGKIDILVCNAAVNPFYGSMADLPDDAFDKILSVNIQSNHWLAQMVLPQMVERNAGSVIIVSSVGGLKGSPVLGAYCISKAADVQLVRNLAVEYGPHNITVNAISPGLVRTDFARALWDSPERTEAAVKSYPMGRLGEAEDVAGIAVYLGAKAGAWTTGQTFVIDGGKMSAGGDYN